MNGQSILKIEQTWECWMHINNPRMTVEKAVEKLKALGNTILEVDKKNRRIKVLHINS